jgi:drug/metabolite transporter (DMT)-like permease
LFGCGYGRIKYYFLAWSVGWYYLYMGSFRHYSRLTLEEYRLHMVTHSFFYLLYGGVIVDKKRPDRYELVGSLIAISGTAIIMLLVRSVFDIILD